ncbi:MAG: hypothetical protein VCA35_10100, partial [Roseibacillus sp.]
DQSAFLTGKSEKSARDRFFYHIRNELQAVRHNEWKLILPKSKLRYSYARDPQFPEAELYNLAKDIGESKNVAAEHPEIVARLSAMAKEVPSLGKKGEKVSSVQYTVHGPTLEIDCPPNTALLTGHALSPRIHP